MNQEKLAKLQAQVRIGGKVKRTLPLLRFLALIPHLALPRVSGFCSQGTARRKKKVVHRTATADDKKLQSSLKKLAVNNIAGIEEVE